ncbi:MAG: hypothetical protein NT145_07655 [Elusimicrobia bacterium]|nr:hypothetical protein [Elusimicrobiota bacterium]
MKVNVGLWIDHKKAVIVFITEGKEKRSVVESGLEKMFRAEQGKGSGDSHGRYDFPKYDINDRDFRGHLNNYLDKVVKYLRGVESVLIFGPGETKKELVKRIKKSNLKGSIMAVEPADKITDRQIAAKVRKYFLKHK